MKHQAKSLLLTIPIFNVKLRITVVDNLEMYFKYKKYDKTDIGKFNHIPALVYHHIQDYLLDIIFIKKKYQEGDLIHELVHIVNAIMKYVGIIQCEESEEAFAYLQEYIYLRINYVLKNKLLKK